MEGLQALVAKLHDEIEDVEEETFLLYSQPILTQNLGFIDPKVPVLDLTIGGRDFSLQQSPTVLSSSRSGGTTGAVLWKLSALFAEWLSSASNVLFTTSALSASSAILELGCGVSPLNALALSSRVASYTLTDQLYVQKLLQANLQENLPPSEQPRRRTGRPSPSSRAAIRFRPLDWETDEVASVVADGARSFDAVVACDCVYNYALVPPFVATCADACKLRANEGDGAKPCLCIVAHQLRDDEVFRSWLLAFHAAFRVWRMPDSLLPEGLRSTAGFVVHLGILRDGGP